jgi:hypothetical protein
VSYSLRDAVVRQALLRGQGRERACRVSAIEVTNRSAPAHPAYTQPVVIHDPQDDFPEGDYELIVGEQTFRLLKRNDEYLGIP